VPNLLVDISQTGLPRPWKKLFQPGQEVKKDFYAELPIHIQLTGSYHEFGHSSAASRHCRALSRCTTSRSPDQQGQVAAYDQLQLDLTAKTYRYLDDDEVAAAEAERRKADQAKRHGS